jgi:hypothetical protein
VAGWGPIFGETLALALIAVIILSFARWWQVKMSAILGVWCALILASVFSNPHAWWARFTPQLWIVPILITLWTLYITRRTWLRGVAYPIALLLCINSGAVLLMNIAGVQIGNALVESQLSALQMRARERPIHMALNRFVSARVRLLESRVQYIEVVSSDQLPCEQRWQRRIALTEAEYCQ